jgi:multicomponent Na+:H+ antiporter subunit D
MSAVLLIVVPLLLAFLSILSKKIAPYLLLGVSGVATLALIFQLFTYETISIGGFNAPYGIELIFDSYSYYALLVVNGLFFITALFNIKAFYKLASILLVGLAGLNGLLLTGDLFNLFVFLEITAISAYLIASTNQSPVHTFHYVVAGTVGSSLYLLGLILLYNMFGTLNMADMTVALEGVNPVVVAFPFLLMFIGLGVEAKLLPFNAWVKGILGHSNSLSGPMIAGVYAGATLFVFGRLLGNVFILSDSLMMIVLVVVGFSILAGEAMAYASTKVREILLFSSVAQAGIAIIVFAFGFTEYALLFVGLNAVSKVVLFLVFNTMIGQVGNDEVASLQGIFRKHPVLGFGMTVIILSLLGLPLFVGFTVKVNILLSFIDAGNVVFPAIILISSVIEGVYFVKLLVALWHQEGTENVLICVPMVVFTLVVAIALIILGTYQLPLEQFVDQFLALKGGWFL